VRRWMTLCVVAALALLVAAGARPQPALAVRSACGWQQQPPRTYKHVIIIMHENHSFEHIMGNRHAPFLNGIARRCGMATNSWATAHLSYFDYSAATSGLNYPSRTGPTIFGQVRSRGLRWGVYSQSQARNCLMRDAYPYESGHNPATHYRLRGCDRHAKSLGTPRRGPLQRALVRRRLPAYTWIVPDKCHDMHDKCYGDAVGTADNWTQAWIRRIVRSRTYQRGRTVIFITWDEGWKKGMNQLRGWDCLQHIGDISCHIPTIVISPYTRHGTRSSTFFSHYSLLKTTEQLLGIHRYLGHAGDRRTNSMRSAFHL
jgi:phosphatidylinositol-3-phosphatase